jgi:hypothetical protein
MAEPTALVASSPNAPSVGSAAAYTFTANATSAPFMIQDLLSDHARTGFAIAASGTFGSGTLTLQTSPDGGTNWFAIGTAVTAAGYINVGTPMGDPMATASNTHRMFRLVLTGATSPVIAARIIT